MTEHTFQPDCWCNGPPPLHEDDSYGDCTTCREWVHHTEDEYRHVAFPCAVAIQAKERAVVEAAKAWRRGVMHGQYEPLPLAAAVDALLEAERTSFKRSELERVRDLQEAAMNREATEAPR
jgi:hypothetical protein